MSQKLTIPEDVQVYLPGDDNKRPKREACQGVIEFIVKDKNGNVVQRWEEPNIVKIFAKEILSHRLPSSKYWDPLANGGTGAWVDSDLDPDEEFSARYILIGASFDDSGIPIEEDPRYYTTDPVTGTVVPIRLEPGADYDGELINSVPLTEPGRPLKRVEAIDFQATYQPAGVPILQSDVRAINNIVLLQTTIKLDEYNGFGLTDSDFFVITEVALAGGRLVDSIGTCECKPRSLFLQGPSCSSGVALKCTASGSDVISIDPSESEVDLIKQGDQIKIVGTEDSQGEETISQVSPFYLVMSKAVGGRDMTLDRTPVTSANVPITGNIGVYRDTLRIFSHRILKTPVKKSADFEITIIWRIIFN